jgi:hypothetical protein
VLQYQVAGETGLEDFPELRKSAVKLPEPQTKTA